MATQKFGGEGLPSPRLDSEVLLMHVLQCSRTKLYVDYDRDLSSIQQKDFENLIRQRLSGKPIAYLVGQKEFMGLDFWVDERVLIPRPETELLVETLLEEIKDYPHPVRVLDIGTGSGAIALSLAYYTSIAEVYALDYSSSALSVAKTNAKNLGLDKKVSFWQGDLWQGIPDKEKGFHVIVSNPPYISSQEMKELDLGVLEYEPHLALSGGEDGLDFYRRISEKISEYLLPGGLLALEVGKGQAREVSSLLLNTNIFAASRILLDYAGIERIVIALRKDK